MLTPLPDPPAPETTVEVPFVDETGDLTEIQQAVPDPASTEDEADEALDTSADQGLPTQAGLPIFHDDDEVSWIAQRTEPAPPPPALEPPPIRPLFAPNPADGQPARRPRTLPPSAESGSGFWPWEGSGPATGAGTGSGVLPAYVEDEEEDDDRPPGVSWLRLAAVVAACLLVLIASVIAFNLGRGRSPLGAVPDTPATSPTSGPSRASTTAGPIAGVAASDFDPQGRPPEENPQEAALAVDGDPKTAWTTSRYNENLGPGGLKTGVGLLLDLGRPHEVTEVQLTTVGAPTTVRIFVLASQPSAVLRRAPAGRATLSGTTGSVKLSSPTTGRYVVVWLTSLPRVAGGFRGEVAEAVVDGD